MSRRSTLSLLRPANPLLLMCTWQRLENAEMSRGERQTSVLNHCGKLVLLHLGSLIPLPTTARPPPHITSSSTVSLYTMATLHVAMVREP